MNQTIWELSDSADEVAGLHEDGTPDPGYADSLGLVQATIGQRVTSCLVDFVGWFLLQVPALLWAWPLVFKWLDGSITSYGFTHHPDFKRAAWVMGVSFGVSLAYCVVNVVLNGVKGITLGKGVTGLRTVNVATLGKPGIGQALVRVAVLWIPAVVVVGPIAVLASPAFDASGRNRGWADKAAGTWVVDIRSGLNPYDEKRMRVARKTVEADPLMQRPALPSLTTADETPSYRPTTRVSAGVLGSASTADLRGTPAAPRARTPLIPPSYQPPANPAPRGPAQSAWAASAQPAAGVAADQPSSAPRRAAQTPLVLVLDSGERVEVGTAVVLGRGPELTESLAGATPISVGDTTYSVSKTHVLVRRVGAGVDVVDLGSTNGTFVLRDGVEYPLTPGQAAPATVGDTIRFGDRTLVVHRAGEDHHA